MVVMAFGFWFYSIAACTDAGALHHARA